MYIRNIYVITRKKKFRIGITVLSLWLSNVIFMLQTHGIISRTWITSSQEYPLNQIDCVSLLVPKTQILLNQPVHIYHFHQKNGFACMMLSEFFELV